MAAHRPGSADELVDADTPGLDEREHRPDLGIVGLTSEDAFEERLGAVRVQHTPCDQIGDLVHGTAYVPNRGSVVPI